MRRRPKLSVLAVPVMGLLVVAGCASSSSSAKSALAQAGITTPSSSATASSAPSGTGSGSGSASGTFCGDLIAYGKSYSQIAQSFAGGTNLKALADTVSQELSRVAADAPSEIKADVTTVSNGIKQLASALDAAGGDVTKVSPSALAAFASPAFQTAAKNLGAYAGTHCH